MKLRELDAWSANKALEFLLLFLITFKNMHGKSHPFKAQMLCAHYTSWTRFTRMISYFIEPCSACKRWNIIASKFAFRWWWRLSIAVGRLSFSFSFFSYSLQLNQFWTSVLYFRVFPSAISKYIDFHCFFSTSLFRLYLPFVFRK